MSTNPVREFFRRHGSTAVGPGTDYPPDGDDPDDRSEAVDHAAEVDPADWKPVPNPEAPTRPGEAPTRFIDGCYSGEPVTCLWNPSHGWPVAVVLAEVGGVAMKLEGRDLRREFYGLERVVSFVADAFPWDEVEAFAAAVGNLPDFPTRLLPARRPGEDANPFVYEVHRQQAEVRAKQEMNNWEQIALDADPDAPTLLDGRLASDLLTGRPRKGLVVGVVKTHKGDYLHDQGWRAFLRLTPGQRTPFFKINRRQAGGQSALYVATWYVKLALGGQPNDGIVRVEVPWAQFVEDRTTKDERTGFASRLSRWLVDARCRQASYGRAAISLDPVVRAEDSLKSLFTPFGVLRNRFLRHAGVAGSAPP
ncbi:MAG: hypothetical protein K2X87_24680 [Gemmataceae bacterium]|nr:hypothetical protein [Gemmataceae bacterium]